MKRLFIKYIAILILCISFSCVDNEPELLFDDVPSERVNASVDQVKQLLLNATNGWKITYFTDDTTLGGYTYLFRFLEDGTVEMDSDFGQTKGTVTSSLWTVDFGATVKLNFTTQNKIHELSDSNSSPDPELTGQGYRGSFEFLFYGIEGENLSFQASRDNTPVLFQKASQQDWDNLSKNDDIINLLNGQLSYVKDGITQTFEFNSDRRFATNEDDQVTDTNFGIGFSPNGIIVSPAITDENEVAHDTFILNDSNSAFISTKGNFSISILNFPFDVNQFWQTQIIDGEVSELFINTFATVTAENTRIWDETLWQNLFFGNVTLSNSPGSGVMLYSFTDVATNAGFFAQYFLTFNGVPNEPSFIDITRSEAGFNWSFYTHLDPVVALMVDNSPFTTELNTPENPTEIKLTSTINSDVWFTIRLSN
jgi:hypothetical protein